MVDSSPKQKEKENNIIQKILDSEYSNRNKSRMFTNKVLQASNSKWNDIRSDIQVQYNASDDDLCKYSNFLSVLYDNAV